MTFLGLLFGAVVGLSLGMTGGGGAIFAVPLLVYGLGVPAREAVAIALAAVGATALLGFLHRWRLGEVEIPTGFLFAGAGMLGAPMGTWLASLLPDTALMLGLAGLMLIVAVRLWQQGNRPAMEPQSCPDPETANASTCQRDAAGGLRLNSRCAMLLILVGIVTGLLSGMFGVGGGFVIVPALVLFSGMPIHRAVGTSLMVISLVSTTGIAALVWGGRTLPIDVTALFMVGGIAGLFLGQRIARKLPGPVLQKVFAMAILAVAAFVIFRNLSA
jgi:uncharacterized protein